MNVIPGKHLIYKNVCLFVLFLLLIPNLFSQTKETVAIRTDTTSYCLTQDEIILYNLINDLRRQNKKSVIPLSKSLSLVSAVHISDLLTWDPQEQGCNLHSWSNRGNWTACCSSKEPKGSGCMNSKPGEIAGYPGKGYELVYWEEEKATPLEAFELWKQVGLSNDMILNKGKWQNNKWNAMGVAIKGGYAIIWLGEKHDTKANIRICESDSLVQSAPFVNLVSSADSKGKPSSEVKEIRNQESSKTGSANQYYLIVASLQTSELANEKMDELKKKGYKDMIIIKSSDRYRISVGSYPTEAQAKARQKELRKEFPDCWMLRE